MTKVEKLQAALRWALEGNVARDHEPTGFRTAGCGCCAYGTQPPEELRAVIMEALKQCSDSKPTGSDKT